MNEKFKATINLDSLVMHNGQLADPRHPIARAMG